MVESIRSSSKSHVNGESGFFETSLAAYGQEGEPCLRCGLQIKRIASGNRSPNFCPKCQVKGVGRCLVNGAGKPLAGREEKNSKQA